MKFATGFKTSHALLITLMIIGSVLLAGCFGDNASDSSSSNTQESAITPVGVPEACLTVHPPSLIKLTGGYYQLVVEIDNCGGKVAGPLQVTAQIDAGTTKQSTNLFGTASISSYSKANYSTSKENTSESKKKEVHFLTPASSSALVTILVMIRGSMQGEWDGQVSIPA